MPQQNPVGGPAALTDKTIEPKALEHPPAQDVPQSIHANLSQGYCVGLGVDGGVMSVNPTGYSSDDAAIQDVNDWLADPNPRAGGDIYVPAIYPGGGRWVIENQVVVGDPNEERRVQNNLYFVGFAEDQDSFEDTGDRVEMGTTINDGSAMFRVVANSSATGDSGDFSTIRAYNFHGGKFDLGGNDAGLVRFQYVTNIDMWIETCWDFAGDAVFFDTRCNEPHLRRGRFSGADGSNARTIVFDDTLGDGTTTQAYIGEGVNTDGDVDVSIYARGTNSLFVDGKYEGSHGIAHIDARSAYGNGCNLYVDSKTQLGNNHSGSHGVYFDGYQCNVSPGRLNQISGDGIVLQGVGDRASIPESVTYNAIGGNYITINEDSEFSRITAPYPTQVDGPVSYPAEPQQSLCRPDGWRLFRSGTETIPAGTTQKVNQYGAGAGSEIKVTTGLSAAPSGDCQVRSWYGWAGAQGQASTHVEEVSGSNDAPVIWYHWVRD